MITKAEKLGIDKMKVGDVIRCKMNPWYDANNYCNKHGLNWKFKSVKNVYGVYEMIRMK